MFIFALFRVVEKYRTIQVAPTAEGETIGVMVDPAARIIHFTIADRPIEADDNNDQCEKWGESCPVLLGNFKQLPHWEQPIYLNISLAAFQQVTVRNSPDEWENLAFANGAYKPIPLEEDMELDVQNEECYKMDQEAIGVWPEI